MEGLDRLAIRLRRVGLAPVSSGRSRPISAPGLDNIEKLGAGSSAYAGDASRRAYRDRDRHLSRLLRTPRLCVFVSSPGGAHQLSTPPRDSGNGERGNAGIPE